MYIDLLHMYVCTYFCTYCIYSVVSILMAHFWELRQPPVRLRGEGNVGSGIHSQKCVSGVKHQRHVIVAIAVAHNGLPISLDNGTTHKHMRETHTQIR